MCQVIGQTEECNGNANSSLTSTTSTTLLNCISWWFRCPHQTTWALSFERNWSVYDATTWDDDDSFLHIMKRKWCVGINDPFFFFCRYQEMGSRLGREHWRFLVRGLLSLGGALSRGLRRDHCWSREEQNSTTTKKLDWIHIKSVILSITQKRRITFISLYDVSLPPVAVVAATGAGTTSCVKISESPASTILNTEQLKNLPQAVPRAVLSPV